MERRLEWAQDGEEVGSNRVKDPTRANGGVLTFGAARPATHRGMVTCGALLGGQPLSARLPSHPARRTTMCVRRALGTSGIAAITAGNVVSQRITGQWEFFFGARWSRLIQPGRTRGRKTTIAQERAFLPGARLLVRPIGWVGREGI